MMKILRTYLYLPPYKGGMEKHIFNLSTFQNRNGHRISVYYYDGENISKNDVKIKTFNRYSIKPQFINILAFYSSICLKLLFKNENFDVVHIHGDWSSVLFAKLLKKLTKAKIVVFSLHDQLSSSMTHQKLLPRLVQNIDLIFSTGYDTAKELERLSSKSVIVQPSGINEIFFEKFNKSFENKIFTIVIVANLFPKKNIELVLDIAKEMDAYIFIIVGEGTNRKTLEDKIKSKNISNVNLVGFKNVFELKEYYQNSDCYLLSSFAEGTPTSALEAMACGLPIVSSNAGGLGNIVQEYENGFIIDDFDKNKYIEKIQLLKSDLELRKKMCKNNILLARKYKWKNVAQNITCQMEKVLNEKN